MSTHFRLNGNTRNTGIVATVCTTFAPSSFADNDLLHRSNSSEEDYGDEKWNVFRQEEIRDQERQRGQRRRRQVQHANSQGAQPGTEEECDQEQEVWTLKRHKQAAIDAYHQVKLAAPSLSSAQHLSAPCEHFLSIRLR